MSENCAHYWIIESAKSGPMSKGICKYCGEEKMFDNTGDQGRAPVVLKGMAEAPHSRSKDAEDYYEGEEVQE